MADTKISGLTDGGTILVTDSLPAVRSGANVKVVVKTLATKDTASLTADVSGVLPAANGGTGVGNSSTITIGGNVTFSGSFTTAFTVTGNTTVTFPTTGTMISNTVTTLSSLISIGTISTGVWNGTIITSAYGGTGNGFTKFSGPASTEKTFTLPNASDTIACLGTAQTFTKAQSTSPTSLSSSSNHIATDASTSNVFTHTLTENTTLDNPTNLVTGTYYTWYIVQASSAKTLAYGTKFKWPSGTAMTVSTGSGAVDIITAYYDGTNLNSVFSQAFA